jgi:2-oxoisovalerate dehydrogenase E1 component alpha subunit
MNWIDPAAQAPIETFRLMNSDSVIEDESRISPEVTPEVVLGWYKNMLTGEKIMIVAFVSNGKADKIL